MNTLTDTPTPCPLCGGDTLRYRGAGRALEKWCCPRWQEPGHLSKEAMLELHRAKMAEAIQADPSILRWA